MSSEMITVLENLMKFEVDESLDNKKNNMKSRRPETNGS
jgi:hypothetical protein